MMRETMDPDDIDAILTPTELASDDEQTMRRAQLAALGGEIA